MELLKEKIRREGVILPGDILKVDGFLNHRMDVAFLCEVGREFARRFDSCGINKILTVEASGIGIACLTAQYFDVPVVFAKKSKSKNIGTDVYTAKVDSYTHGNCNDIVVSKKYLSSEDRVLLIDDFLARGSALRGLVSICKDAGAEVVGAGVVIEKAYQGGGDLIREMGVRVESLARVGHMSEDGKIEFLA